uniref:Uncharacterized protein n=1 Tax=Oncorhynchus tshawytscha TaxID=74940 RepID=A0AAZ3P5T8_ONCTS
MLAFKWLSIYLTLFCSAYTRSLFDIGMTLFQVERMFPEHVFKNTQGEDVSVVALESLEYMAQLFNSLTPKLEGCVGCGVGASSGDGGSVTSGKGSLKTYFNKLNTILIQKEHSACAWEITRVEVRDNLVQFKKFLDSSQLYRVYLRVLPTYVFYLR